MRNGKAVFQLAWGVLFLVALTSVSHAAAPDGKVRAFDIPLTEKLGREIYEQDSYAWRATDLVLEQNPGLTEQNVSGWIVEPDGDGAIVRFFKVEANRDPRAVYDVIFTSFDASPTFSRAERPVTDAEKVQFAARQLALAAVQEPCSKHYNTVVLKDPEGDGWLVYALAASDGPEMVVGGHYRLSVSADGAHVLSSERLSRSCLTLPAAQGPGAEKDVAAVVRQVLSDTPLETIVFLSLMHKKPIFVMTEHVLWEVQSGKVVEIERR